MILWAKLKSIARKQTVGANLLAAAIKYDGKTPEQIELTNPSPTTGWKKLERCGRGFTTRLRPRFAARPHCRRMAPPPSALLPASAISQYENLTKVCPALPLVTLRGDMIDRAVELDSQWPCHDLLMSVDTNSKSKRPDPALPLRRYQLSRFGDTRSCREALPGHALHKASAAAIKDTSFALSRP
jgi:hypothetical protein